MARLINTRSPFYIKVYHEQLVEASLELYIYEGAKETTPDAADLKYSIQKAELEGNNYVVFEISELVRDYIENKYSGEPSSYVVWVNPVVSAFRANGTIIGTAETIPANLSEQFVATDGYGYFEEGINPDLDEGLLMSEGTVYRYDAISDNAIESAYKQRISDDGGVFEYNSLLEIFNDRSIGVPVSAETTNSVTFKYKGSDVKVVSISDNDNTNQKIQYVTFNSGSVDEIVISYTKNSETLTKTLKVKEFNCSKYETIRVTFVNKFGALQDLYFTRRSNESVSVETQDYKASVLDFANFSYDTSSHQRRTLNLIGNQSITLNTDYIDEDNNEYIKQLMLSEQIWMTKLTDLSNVIPLKLKSNSLQLKKRVNDKLIQYTMEFDVAADMINNIR